MFKKFLFIIALLFAGASFAAVDVNKASAAELDGIKGIGPAMSEKILNERKNSEFKDWNDFIGRVGGVGEKTAAKFSAEGLTVNGKRFSAAAQAKADKKKKEAEAKASKTAAKGEDKPASKKKDKAAEPAAAAAPQANASDAKK
ncbi:ComEA family DNA-binding protein [Acidovorax sp.]|jgi:competence protein ComEA|uniref:ComEA family DNA-binding protein n=1 Tax=Acidovorax sp. TaxID=1872122 RepID=UPI00391FB02B